MIMISFSPSLLKESLSDLTVSSNHIGCIEQEKYLDYYGLPQLQDGEYTMGKLNHHAYSIIAQIWKPNHAKKTVFIVHGYTEHMGLCANIIRFFIEQQCCVFIFDLPGHGLSSGDPGHIDDFENYVQILEYCIKWSSNQKLPAPYSVYGISTGGAIVTHSVGMNRLDSRYPIESVILSAPLVRIPFWFLIRFMLNILSLFTHKIKRKLPNMKHCSMSPQIILNDPLQLQYIPLSWLKALYRWEARIKSHPFTIDKPTFIIQGTVDTRVHWRYNLKFLSTRYTSITFCFLENADHLLNIASKSILEQYLLTLSEWLKQFRG